MALKFGTSTAYERQFSSGNKKKSRGGDRFDDTAGPQTRFIVFIASHITRLFQQRDTMTLHS